MQNGGSTPTPCREKVQHYGLWKSPFSTPISTFHKKFSSPCYLNGKYCVRNWIMIVTVEIDVRIDSDGHVLDFVVGPGPVLDAFEFEPRLDVNALDAIPHRQIYFLN